MWPLPLPIKKGGVVTENKRWMDELKEAFGRLGLKADNDCCVLIGQVVDDKMAHQNVRIEKLEERMNAARVTLAETDGRIGNVKTGMEGEMKLVHEMLSQMGEKIERIEANTSREQNAKRMWRVAFVAAIPGVMTVLIMLAELLVNGR